MNLVVTCFIGTTGPKVLNPVSGSGYSCLDSHLMHSRWIVCTLSERIITYPLPSIEYKVHVAPCDPNVDCRVCSASCSMFLDLDFDFGFWTVCSPWSAFPKGEW